MPPCYINLNLQYVNEYGSAMRYGSSDIALLPLGVVVELCRETHHYAVQTYKCIVCDLRLFPLRQRVQKRSRLPLVCCSFFANACLFTTIASEQPGAGVKQSGSLQSPCGPSRAVTEPEGEGFQMSEPPSPGPSLARERDGRIEHISPRRVSAMYRGRPSRIDRTGTNRLPFFGSPFLGKQER